MQFAAKTDTGKLRERNEDRYYFNTQLQLFAIADGMSGHESGDVASLIALEIIQEWAKTQASPQSDLGPMKRLAVLTELAEEANQHIYTAAENSGKARGMGTTLIAGFVTFSYLTYVHVGDSRLYVLRDEKLTQITTDDSIVQKMVEKGEITLEESRTHEKRNIITKAIGLMPTVDVNADAYPLVAGDIVLACTDGLHDLIIDDREIAEIILAADNIEEAGQNLINKALDYGGTDNVTVLLVAVD
jgi:protein phosphatase